MNTCIKIKKFKLLTSNSDLINLQTYLTIFFYEENKLNKTACGFKEMKGRLKMSIIGKRNMKMNSFF